MKIVGSSKFKNPERDLQWFDDWKSRVKRNANRVFEDFFIDTSLGKTGVYSCGNPNSVNKLVIFPGFRTSSLFWDLDRGLDYFIHNCQVFLIETNGQPNASEGLSPAIRSLDYGIWAAEVLDQLHLDKTFVAGASFGGLVCMKLALVAPQKLQGVFLLNPGCLQNFSLKWKNLSANLKPIIFPNEKNVRAFLDIAVFCRPNHNLEPQALDLLVEYELKAIRDYKDNTQKPYFMNHELRKVNVPTWLFCGDKDTLFPIQKSFDNAKRLIPSLVECIEFKNVAHGIETYRPALEKLAQVILEYNKGR